MRYLSDFGSDKTVPLLEEILKWVKFEGRKDASEMFRSKLDSDTEKIVYELSDGRSSPSIARIVRIDPSTVREYWHKWARDGMMELCPGYRRRYCRIFSLGELGIEVPDIEAQVSEESEEEDE